MLMHAASCMFLKQHEIFYTFLKHGLINDVQVLCSQFIFTFTLHVNVCLYFHSLLHVVKGLSIRFHCPHIPDTYYI